MERTETERTELPAISPEGPPVANEALRQRPPGGQHRGKRLLSVVVSAILAAWLIWFVSPTNLFEAFGQLNWPVLLPVTVIFIVGLYLWDAVCLWRLFDDRARPLRYGTALHARGYSYLFGIFNYELGQGLLAWMLAKAQDKSMFVAVGRCLVLAYVDLCILFAMGLVGALLHDDPRTFGIGVFCGVALAGLVLATAALRWSPPGRVRWLSSSRLGQWLSRWDLKWKQITPLYGLRVVFFLINMVYVAIGLWICNYPITAAVMLTVIPIIAIVNALPISFSGLGTREATLMVLLRPEEPAALLAFSLVWTASIIFGRAIIGLGHLWGASARPAAAWSAAPLAE